jgi:hypothetical protein
MRDNQDIKDQIRILRDLANKSNPVVSEHIREIKKTYLTENYIFEADEEIEVDDIATRYDVANAVEDEIEDNEGLKNDIKQGYRISGGVLTIHGDTKKDTEITTDDKKAFQETMDEFVNEVSDLVNFDELNIYANNVEWSGKIVDFDIDYYFTIGESNGIYISGDMVKLDENFLSMTEKLQQYYEKFKSKWAKVLAQRKKTKPVGNS